MSTTASFYIITITITDDAQGYRYLCFFMNKTDINKDIHFLSNYVSYCFY